MIETTKARGIPSWLSLLIVIGAIVGAVYLVRWFVTTGPSGVETVVLDRGPEDGVQTKLADKSWTVQSGNNGLRILRNRDGVLRPAFYFVHYDFVTPAQFEVLNNGRRIALDGAVRAALGVSEQQLAELSEHVRQGFDLQIPAADSKRLADLFADYLAASPSGLEGRETALLRALDEVGDRALADAHRATADAAARIRAIVTADQWKKFEQMGL